MEQNMGVFGEMMFSIRKQLYEMHEENETLSKQLKDAFTQEGMRFGYFKFMKEVGFTNYGSEGINTILRKRPRILEHLMNQHQHLLERRLDSSKEYLRLIDQEKGTMLNHLRYLNTQGKELRERDAQLAAQTESISQEHRSLLEQIVQSPEENTLREKEMATRFSLQDIKRAEQNTHVRLSFQKNSQTTACVLFEQMGLAYSEVDLMRETLQAQHDYTKTITKGQVAVGIMLEDMEKVLEHYTQYREVCNKLLLGLNVGIQAIMQDLSINAGKAIYEPQALENAARLCKDSEKALDGFRASLRLLAHDAGKQHLRVENILQQVDAQTKTLASYAQEDFKRYDELIIS